MSLATMLVDDATAEDRGRFGVQRDQQEARRDPARAARCRRAEIEIAAKSSHYGSR